jgi:hypothetical protein
MVAPAHKHVTNLSGNEIYCLNRLGLRPGNICVGNSVFALGIMGSLTAGLNILAGELLIDNRLLFPLTVVETVEAISST